MNSTFMSLATIDREVVVSIKMSLAIDEFN